MLKKINIVDLKNSEIAQINGGMVNNKGGMLGFGVSSYLSSIMKREDLTKDQKDEAVRNFMCGFFILSAASIAIITVTAAVTISCINNRFLLRKYKSAKDKLP